LGILIGFIIRAIAPINDIRDIDVNPKDVKTIGFCFVLYYILSLALVMLLVILLRR
jgi:hypothetical protein